jgi:hypothetical protein
MRISSFTEGASEKGFTPNSLPIASRNVRPFQNVQPNGPFLILVFGGLKMDGAVFY